MLPWWIAVIAFLFGSAFGYITAALLVANERNDRP